MLAALLDAGVPLPDALPTSIDCANNLVYKERLTAAMEGVLEGRGFADPLASTELFPSTVIQMVRVGERTGELSDQLDNAAGFYEEELDYAVEKLTAWFEPIIILFIGVVVGFVALAMVSAMYGHLQPGGALATMLGRRGRRTGQAGQSLVELIIAILLLGTVFLSLAGALTAINRGTATNEKVQSIDSAMLAYGEVIRTQVGYQACVGNMADTYQAAGENFITGNGQPGTNVNWRRPTGMVTEVIGVESWNSSTKAFEDRAPR